MVAAKVLRHIVINKDKMSFDEEKQQTSSILADVNSSSMKSIEQEVVSLPLQKKLRELMDEIEKQQKLIKTLELELKVNFFQDVFLFTNKGKRFRFTQGKRWIWNWISLWN